MNNYENLTRLFQQFAEDKLNNHVGELNTRYENERLGSEELRQRAYQDHRNIYEQELDEKIHSLLRQGENDWLQGELQNLKHQYLGRLER
jgi:hypothetical protein